MMGLAVGDDGLVGRHRLRGVHGAQLVRRLEGSVGATLPWYSGRMKFYLAVFLSVLVAELGDKTQIATLLFAADPETGKLGVFLAAAAALIASSALAVVVGAHIGR